MELLLKEIAVLESKHKATRGKNIKHELDIKVAQLRSLETSQAVKSLLYASQHLFDYRDKPNKQLARVLALHKSTRTLP